MERHRKTVAQRDGPDHGETKAGSGAAAVSGARANRSKARVAESSADTRAVIARMEQGKRPAAALTPILTAPPAA